MDETLQQLCKIGREGLVKLRKGIRKRRVRILRVVGLKHMQNGHFRIVVILYPKKSYKFF